jgi:hypothetical protein
LRPTARAFFAPVMGIPRSSYHHHKCDRGLAEARACCRLAYADD